MPKASKTGGFRKAAAAASQKSNHKDASPSASKNETVFVPSLEKTKDQSIGQAQTSNSTSTEQLSRGQRKRQAKRDQYQRRQKLVLSSLKVKRAEEQKKRIDGLDAIKEALLSTVSSSKKSKEEEIEEDADETEEKPNLLKTNKSRQLLVQKESQQLSLVMEHPSFQQDPFATMREHLQNTLASDAAARKKEEIKHNKVRKQKDEEKKAIKKEHRHKKKHRVRATRSRGK
eukprot:CAMPEP_0172443780 /NCGR_PEP_ID=MMETSP1065-20121228/3987_1 /TAXON_ID=265537 /ORGANISM="Amphiprora paludosa, Strain CCMP125" /LENGTH=229 /DNA_ID=CAMNT_0013194117 /DNA_START=47 /DNA_END=736 /DNA_ORIENTATION=-